jgi:hypothetical protein
MQLKVTPGGRHKTLREKRIKNEIKGVSMCTFWRIRYPA